MIHPEPPKPESIETLRRALVVCAVSERIRRLIRAKLPDTIVVGDPKDTWRAARAVHVADACVVVSDDAAYTAEAVAELHRHWPGVATLVAGLETRPEPPADLPFARPIDAAGPFHAQRGRLLSAMERARRKGRARREHEARVALAVAARFGVSLGPKNTRSILLLVLLAHRVPVATIQELIAPSPNSFYKLCSRIYPHFPDGSIAGIVQAVRWLEGEMRGRAG